MSTSTTGIWIICVVGVLGLIAAVVIVRLASRRPHHANPQRGQLRGLVQGGQHVGGGRSVAPTRDAPVPEGGGEPPSIEEEVTAHEEEAAAREGRPSRPDRSGARRESGNPMNL
jgi:hypothetical protein